MTQYLDVEKKIKSLSHDLHEYIEQRQLDDVLMVGIHTGGVWVAKRLYQSLELTSQLAELNISFYRDDFTRIGMHPQVQPSKLPATVDGRHIILVDDVLYTGRTIKAALHEIFDYGRPASVALVVLIDRGGRELPIQADFVGRKVVLEKNQQIKLTGPTPLELSIVDARADR